MANAMSAFAFYKEISEGKKKGQRGDGMMSEGCDGSISSSSGMEVVYSSWVQKLVVSSSWGSNSRSSYSI